MMFHTILIRPVLNVLMLVISIIPGHDFGLGVIFLTLLVRFLLWPLAAKQLHSQRKLQALQPEIAKVKQKAAGDRQKEALLLQELYREREINPFSACLPLLLQFPVLLAFYFVFREAAKGVNSFAHDLYGPVSHLGYIKGLLASPDSFKPTLLGLVSMAKPSIVLAIIAAASQYVQVRMLTPRPAKSAQPDPQAQAMQLMNYMFPALTGLIALQLPAALPLYWTVTNLVSIAQQRLVMSGEVEKMEEMDEVKIVKTTAKKPAGAKKGKK